MKLLKVTFQKSQKLLLAEKLREMPPIQNISIAIHSISKVRYCMDVQRMDIQRLPSFEVMIVTAT